MSAVSPYGRGRRAASRQRWALTAIAVFSIACALSVVAIATDLSFGIFSVIVTLLALASMGYLDTSFPTIVIVLVVVRWMVSDGSPTSPAVLLVAAALAAFHTIAALLAAVPPSATVPSDVLRSWGRRWSVVVGATSVWWAALALFSRREAGPSVVATIGALVVVVLGLVVVRRRVVDATGDDETSRSGIAG